MKKKKKKHDYLSKKYLTALLKEKRNLGERGEGLSGGLNVELGRRGGGGRTDV